jgi:peptidoglycan/LPS O-acetylase OafA/YrhL
MLGINFDQRIFGLDLMRFIAIVTVLYNHGWAYAQKFVSKKTYDFFHFDGVTLFFVLSGFLIGGIVFNVIEKNGATWQTLGSFWKNRWFRTLPLYFLILSFLTLQLIIHEGVGQFPGLIKYFFFFQNFYNYKTTFFSESWSLSVEEWFYLTFPLFLWFMVGTLKISIHKSALLIIFAFILCSFCMRYIKYNELIVSGLFTINNKSLDDKFPFLVICRLDSLMYGIFAAYLFRYKRQFWEKHKFAAVVAGCAIVVCDYSLKFLLTENTFQELKESFFYKHVLHYSVLPFALALMLPFFNGLKQSKNIPGRIIILISVISYSLYLTHMSVVINLRLPQRLASISRLPGREYLSYVLYWGITVVLSCFVYYFFERPMTNLRDRNKTNFKTLANLGRTERAHEPS